MRKPFWAVSMQTAARLEREAQEFRRLAQDMRCGAEDSGGARCSADQGHGGPHRHELADLPLPQASA